MTTEDDMKLRAVQDTLIENLVKRKVDTKCLDAQASQMAAQGMIQREIAQEAYRYQRRVESGEQIVVGVNRYQQADEQPPEILRIDPALERKQVERLTRVRQNRDDEKVHDALDRLAKEAADPAINLMPALVDASKAYVTEGEMMAVFTPTTSPSRLNSGPPELPRLMAASVWM